MAQTIKALREAVCGQVDVTIAANNTTGSASFAFANANKYVWTATQYATSGANMLTGLLVTGVQATSTGVQVFVDRQLRSGTSSALTAKVNLVGVRYS